MTAYIKLNLKNPLIWSDKVVINCFSLNSSIVIENYEKEDNAQIKEKLDFNKFINYVLIVLNEHALNFLHQ
jgi:hypothetical protein